MKITTKDTLEYFWNKVKTWGNFTYTSYPAEKVVTGSNGNTAHLLEAVITALSLKIVLIGFRVENNMDLYTVTFRNPFSSINGYINPVSSLNGASSSDALKYRNYEVSSVSTTGFKFWANTFTGSGYSRFRMIFVGQA